MESGLKTRSTSSNNYDFHETSFLIPEEELYP